MFQVRHIVIAIVTFACAIQFATSASAQVSLWNTILSRATAARDNAAQARNHAQDVREEMQEALQTLSGEMRDFINDYVSEISRVIDEEKEGRDEFVNGAGCGTFRQDMIAMLEHMEGIFNELNLIVDPDGAPISFADEIDIVNDIPCKVLFPLYRVMMVTGGFGPHMLEMLEEGAIALANVGVIVAAAYEDFQGDSLIDFEVNQTVNQFIISNPATVYNAKRSLRKLSIVLKTGGKRMTSKSETGIQTIPIQIWGWVGVELKIGDMRRKMGSLFTGLSEQLSKVETIVATRRDHAMLFGSLAEIRDNQLEILANQATILELLQDK